MIDDLTARQPGWDTHTFPSIGHLLPREAPHAYTQTAGQWLARPASPSKEAADQNTESEHRL